MSARLTLSEADEQAERADRDELYRLEGKIREARARRSALLMEVRQLSSEQKALYDQRQPRQEALEGLNREHQELGRALGEIRRAREAARRQMDESLQRLREFRALTPRIERARPEQIQREIAQLEMRQQTTAVPIAEENQMILRLRELTRALEEARKHSAETDARVQRLKELEAALAQARAEFDRLAVEMDRARIGRERTMQAMRARLVDEGKIVAEMREKGRRRAEVMERLDASNREVGTLEREADRLFNQLRNRRHEARQTVREYNREVRQTVAGPDAYARAAESQLQELLKRGRVTLGG